MVVRTVALSSICSALLVCVVYTLKRTTVLFPCQQRAQSVHGCRWRDSLCSSYFCTRKIHVASRITSLPSVPLPQPSRSHWLSYRCASYQDCDAPKDQRHRLVACPLQ